MAPNPYRLVQDEDPPVNLAARSNRATLSQIGDYLTAALFCLLGAADLEDPPLRDVGGQLAELRRTVMDLMGQEDHLRTTFDDGGLP